MDIQMCVYIYMAGSENKKLKKKIKIRRKFQNCLKTIRGPSKNIPFIKILHVQGIGQLAQTRQVFYIRQSNP